MSQTRYRGNGRLKLCCVVCEPTALEVKKRAVERVQLWRERRKANDLVAHRASRAAEAMKYRAESREKVRSYRRDHYEANKARLAAYRAAYIKANPGFNRAAAARHRADVLKRTVAWADLTAIKEFYKNCPAGMVVDHIIPLRGKTVSGLHVLSNLQYLTAFENGSKSNHFPEALRA